MYKLLSNLFYIVSSIIFYVNCHAFLTLAPDLGISDFKYVLPLSSMFLQGGANKLHLARRGNVSCSYLQFRQVQNRSLKMFKAPFGISSLHR